jgi:flagellar protein FliS
MNQTNMRNYAKHYNKMAVQTGVESGSPHRLVQMLLEGALEKIAIAKGHLDRGDMEGKGHHIRWAVSIIEGLRTSLDMEQGGDIASNLNDLYDYMKRVLLEAHVSNNVDQLDEVSSLLREIKEAWDAIAPETGS